MIRKIIKRIRYGFYDSNSYCKYLRNRGISIGNNVHFLSQRIFGWT